MAQDNISGMGCPNLSCGGSEKLLIEIEKEDLWYCPVCHTYIRDRSHWWKIADAFQEEAFERVAKRFFGA